MQVQQIPYEYVNTASSCTFYRSFFFRSLLRSREVSSTTFCIVEEDTSFIVSFFSSTLGYSATREQEAGLKAVHYLLIFDL